MRHDVDQEFDDNLEKIDDDELLNKPAPSFFAIFTTTPGTLILISLGIFLFLYITVDNLEASARKGKKVKDSKSN